MDQKLKVHLDGQSEQVVNWFQSDWVGAIPVCHLATSKANERKKRGGVGGSQQ